MDSFNEGFSEMAVLWFLGYRKFKIINQALNSRLKAPNPPREGSYIDFKFDGFSSGLFGEETVGDWSQPEQIFLKYRQLLRLNRYFGEESKLRHTILHKAYEQITRQTVGWYDFHAKWDEQASD